MPDKQNFNSVIDTERLTVRRLTPLECERLQGFPDGWTDVGGGHPTMASLFDGIGGFPLIWEWLNGKGSCLWASEIEDFPIAVTKYHFPEEGENNEH